MSSLQKDPSGNFHICFRFQGKRFKRSLKTKSDKSASGSIAKLDERVWMIESGHLKIPDGIEAGEFLIYGTKPVAKRQMAKVAKPKYSLSKLFDEYFVTAKNGSLEDSTIGTLEIHRRHLERILSKSLNVAELTPKHLQDYINKRSKAKGKYG